MRHHITALILVCGSFGAGCGLIEGTDSPLNKNQSNLNGATGGVISVGGGTSGGSTTGGSGDVQAPVTIDSNNNNPEAPAAPVVVATTQTSPFVFGDIIDYDGSGPHGKLSVAAFENDTSAVPGVVDTYVRVKSDGTFETGTAQSIIDEAAGGKVPAACLSITSEVAGKLNASQLSALVATIAYGKAKSVQVQIRFGYEMNGNWSPSNSTNGQAYDPTNFKLQWAQVAPAVRAAGGLMVWSPNIPYNDQSAVNLWLPADTSTIDIVALDYYPRSSALSTASLRSALDTIYPIAKSLNKPFVFGESAVFTTGSSVQENASEAQMKVTWLKVLTDASVRADYPLYKGFRWFDYQKYTDTWENYSISADSYAAAAFSAWYKASFASINTP